MKLKTTKRLASIGFVATAFPLLRTVTSVENIPGGLALLTFLSFLVVLLAAYLAYHVIKPSK